MIWVLLIGVALGALARHQWGDAMLVKAKDLAEREKKFLMDEVARLRAQVALHIGAKK